MTDALPSTQREHLQREGAEFSAKIGKAVTVDARISPIGLISVGALVSGILLSTAVIVAAARRKA